MIEKGQLIIQLDGKPIRTFALTGTAVMIGRLPQNDVPLEDALVSRQHAEIRFEAEVPIITDLGSTHGTILNGIKLLPHQPHQLAEGAIFSIGLYTILYTTRETVVVGNEQPNEAEQPDEQAVQRLPAEISVPATVAEEVAIRRFVANARLAYQRTPGSPEAASEWVKNLPIIFQDNDFLRRFLLLFETIWEPLEQRQDQIAMYFDPYTCPASFLPWLASWFGVELRTHWAESLQRSMLKEIVELYRWRGTRYGLARLVEVYAGTSPQIIESPTAPFVFRIRVRLSADSNISREELVALINRHKPAHVGYILETEL